MRLHCENSNNPNCISAGISGSVTVNHLWPVVAGGGVMKDEALDLALEALEGVVKNCWRDIPSWRLDEIKERITAIKQARSAPVQSCYCPNCEAMGKELAALKAQPAPVQPIIGSYLEKDNSQFKFSDYESDGMHHNKPAVPDAFGTREGEHPKYIEGWNDCRAEMLKGMKP